jgi:hypothetical protein
MPHLALAALEGILRPHVALGKSRLETLCLLIVGMVSARTVNLAHIACERPGPAQTASTYRRLQRFFQHVRLERDWALPLVARLVGSDRLAHFPASTIDLLLADREFIGADWLKFLNDNSIPFVIRLREHLRVVTEDGCELTLSARLRGTRKSRGFRARLWAQDAEDAIWFNFAVKRLKGEWLIVASSLPPRRALAAYRRRWAIECMFADLKTRGLNLEDTGLTDPRKLDLLMAIVALALAWAGRAACDLLGRGEPKRKAHGHLAKSWFRTGLERVRNLLRSHPPTAIAPWRILTRKPPKSLGVV